VIASRRETSPSLGLTTSAKVVTAIVAGTMRFSRDSRFGRNEFDRSFFIAFFLLPTQRLVKSAQGGRGCSSAGPPIRKYGRLGHCAGIYPKEGERQWAPNVGPRFRWTSLGVFCRRPPEGGCDAHSLDPHLPVVRPARRRPPGRGLGDLPRPLPRRDLRLVS